MTWGLLSSRLRLDDTLCPSALDAVGTYIGAAWAAVNVHPDFL